VATIRVVNPYTGRIQQAGKKDVRVLPTRRRTAGSKLPKSIRKYVKEEGIDLKAEDLPTDKEVAQQEAQREQQKQQALEQKRSEQKLQVQAAARREQEQQLQTQTVVTRRETRPQSVYGALPRERVAASEQARLREQELSERYKPKGLLGVSSLRTLKEKYVPESVAKGESRVTFVRPKKGATEEFIREKARQVSKKYQESQTGKKLSQFYAETTKTGALKAKEKEIEKTLATEEKIYKQEVKEFEDVTRKYPVKDGVIQVPEKDYAKVQLEYTQAKKAELKYKTAVERKEREYKQLEATPIGAEKVSKFIFEGGDVKLYQPFSQKPVVETRFKGIGTPEQAAQRFVEQRYKAGQQSERFFGQFASTTPKLNQTQRVEAIKQQQRVDEFYRGAIPSVAREPFRDPIKTGALVVTGGVVGEAAAGAKLVGKVVPKLFGGKAGKVISTAGSVAGKTTIGLATAGYGGALTYEIAKAPTPRAKGVVVGRAVSEAALVGVGALRKPTVAPRIEPRVMAYAKRVELRRFQPTVSAPTYKYVPLKRSGELTFGRQGEITGTQTRLYPLGEVSSAIQSEQALWKPAQLSIKRAKPSVYDLKKQYTLRGFGLRRPKIRQLEMAKIERWDPVAGRVRGYLTEKGEVIIRPKRATQLLLTDYPSVKYKTITTVKKPAKKPLLQRLRLGKKAQVAIPTTQFKVQDSFKKLTGGEYFKRPKKPSTSFDPAVSTIEAEEAERVFIPFGGRDQSRFDRGAELVSIKRPKVFTEEKPSVILLPRREVDVDIDVGLSIESTRRQKQVQTQVQVQKQVQRQKQALKTITKTPPNLRRGRKFREKIRSVKTPPTPFIVPDRPKFPRFKIPRGKTKVPSLPSLKTSYTPTLIGLAQPKIKATKGLGELKFTGIGVRPQVTLPLGTKKRKKRKKRRRKK